MKQDYTAPTVEIEIIATELGATIVPSNKIIVDVSKPSIQDVSFTVTGEDGEESATYTLTIEKKFNFGDIVKVRWNNTLSAINNPAYNGGFSFSAYKWYKNGTEIGTKQYYSAGNKGERLNATDKYYLELTDKASKKVLRTWEANPQLKSMEVTAYPNPVAQGTSITVDADVDAELLSNATIDVYSLAGVHIAQHKVQGQLSSIPITGAAGTYILLLTGNEGFAKKIKIVVQ